MKKIIISLLICLLALSTKSFAEDADKRQAIYLDQEDRATVLEEMRTFLQTTQQIIQGVSTNDMGLAANAAKTMGQGASNGVSFSLILKLPLSFKLLAADTHSKFDQIAVDAESFSGRDHTLEQVSELMKNCVACHSMYRIELEKED
jgi:hypothetical protein